MKKTGLNAAYLNRTLLNILELLKIKVLIGLKITQFHTPEQQTKRLQTIHYFDYVSPRHIVRNLGNSEGFYSKLVIMIPMTQLWICPYPYASRY